MLRWDRGRIGAEKRAGGVIGQTWEERGRGREGRKGERKKVRDEKEGRRDRGRKGRWSSKR